MKVFSISYFLKRGLAHKIKEIKTTVGEKTKVFFELAKYIRIAVCCMCSYTHTHKCPIRRPRPNKRPPFNLRSPTLASKY